MLRTNICGADHGIHMTDHVLGTIHHMGDVGRTGAVFSHGPVFVAGKANMRDGHAGDTEGFRRLFAQIVGNGWIQLMGPAVHLLLVVAIDNGAPGKGVGIALGHSKNAKANGFVTERKIHSVPP